ncbi:hypothetical protein EVA_21434 [gut metagenome]|uniref:Uncharacterized protein n=1 Tax=gut metagenome TaxID=749906 RepID=J9F6D6_9ZZZZ
MMKKNDNTKNETLMKAKKLMKVDFDEKQVAETIEKQLAQMPVLTKAELDELQDMAEAFGSEAEKKGCWIGLGSFRVEGKEHPTALVQASGAMGTLALMVAESMAKSPWLEKVFLLAVGLRMKCSEDNENNEDKNEK